MVSSALGSHNGAQFVKSTYSDPSNCVFVARPERGSVAVRDGKEGPDGPVLEFGRDAWRAFAEFAKGFEV